MGTHASLLSCQRCISMYGQPVKSNCLDVSHSMRYRHHYLDVIFIYPVYLHSKRYHFLHIMIYILMALVTPHQNRHFYVDLSAISTHCYRLYLSQISQRCKLFTLIYNNTTVCFSVPLARQRQSDRERVVDLCRTYYKNLFGTTGS
jgi:hypothetical protein